MLPFLFQTEPIDLSFLLLFLEEMYFAQRIIKHTIIRYLITDDKGNI